MKASKLCVGMLAVGILAFGMTAYGQEIRWEPVSWDCGGATLDSQIGSNGVASELEMLAGGCEVTMEIKVSGFGTAPGNPALGAYQGTLDCASLSSGMGDPLTQKTPWADTAIIDGSRSDFVYFDNVAVPAVSVATCDFEFGSTQMGGAEVDLGIVYYGGEMILEVPATAKGTYEIDWNPADTKTFFNDAGGVKIPGLFRTTGKITILTGKCCYDIGPGTTVCIDEVTSGECDAEPGPRAFYPGEECTGPEGTPPASDDDCPSCQTISDCFDANVCTEDHCCTETLCGSDPGCTWLASTQECDLGGGTLVGLGQCYYYDLYDAAVDCCDPITGDTTPIDDGNECTEDVCNADGTVDHNPLTGTPCTNANACVINDECDAGVCVGDLPVDLMVACAIDDDCPAGWFCNLDPGDPMEGFCDCRLSTPLCPEFDDVCYEEGDPVYATVAMEAGSAIVTGGQFLMTYDPTCIEFVSIGPCPGDTMFTTVIDWWVDEVEGLIWYAVIAYDEMTYEVQGTTGPYDLACMEFVKLAGCDPCTICLTSDNPYNTLLSNDRGQSVDILDPECCADEIMLDGDMEMWVPAGAEVNADCGVTYAEILWDAPYATDECLGPLELVCDLEHDGGVPLDPGLIMTGGIFPQGTTYFVCTATDDVCGGEMTKVWTVSVSDQQTMDVEVHLSPTMYAGEFSRCICFDLYVDCVAPEHICTVMDFNGPWNFDAHAREEFKVDKGNYLCIEARDPLHTLRSTAEVECIDNKWTAVFKGDPLLGEYGDAHWLIGGNLDFHEPNGNPDVIDVLDFGVYMSQASVGVTYPDGNTTCETDPPHADINADGVVDSLDYAFLTENFLADSKVGCCEEPGGSYQPITDISVKELRELGLGYMSAGDLNNDGRLNTEDMALYQGAPAAPAKVKRAR